MPICLPAIGIMFILSILIFLILFHKMIKSSNIALLVATLLLKIETKPEVEVLPSVTDEI